MSLEDVITQVNGGKPTLDGENSSTDTEPSTGASTSDRTFTLSVNGNEKTFDLLTLILYGVAIADVLLLYVAIKV